MEPQSRTWSVSYKFLSMCHCHIYAHSRLVEYVRKNGSKDWDFNNTLPFFRMVYEDYKEEIDEEWGREFNVWPKYPRFEINTVNKDSGGYILKPDHVVLQYPPVRSDDGHGKGLSSWAGDFFLPISGGSADIKPGDLTRAMVYELLLGIEGAIRIIKKKPDQAEIYMTQPAAYLKGINKNVPDIPMTVVLGFSDIVFTSDGKSWSVMLPTEGELTPLQGKSICGLSCSGVSMYYLKPYQEQQVIP